ncbi:MAG: LacI family DNA-binding transcriptional regulator [Actinomycetota bacterium]
MAGTGRATLEDVARLAGVSRATASRAVRGGGLVSEANREAVRRAVAELDYVPNRAARSLVTRRTDTIAVVVPEPDSRIFSDPFFAATVAGVVEALEETSHQVVLVMRSRGGGPDRLADYLEGNHADGVVVISHHREDHLPAMIARSGIPAAFVGRPITSVPSLQYVDVDNRSGGRTAAEYLATTGSRTIATVAGPLDMAAAIDRLEGWREGLANAGLDSAIWYEGDFTVATARTLAARILREHPEVDGIFAASDLMASGVLGALHAAGRAVPGDVRVVGFDDGPVAPETDPPLTTLTNPGRELAALATRMVLAALDGKPFQAPVILQPRLVVRASA